MLILKTREEVLLTKGRMINGPIPEGGTPEQIAQQLIDVFEIDGKEFVYAYNMHEKPLVETSDSLQEHPVIIGTVWVVEEVK